MTTTNNVSILRYDCPTGATYQNFHKLATVSVDADAIFTNPHIIQCHIIVPNSLKNYNTRLDATRSMQLVPAGYNFVPLALLNNYTSHLTTFPQYAKASNRQFMLDATVVYKTMYLDIKSLRYIGDLKLSSPMLYDIIESNNTYVSANTSSDAPVVICILDKTSDQYKTFLDWFNKFEGGSLYDFLGFIIVK